MTITVTGENIWDLRMKLGVHSQPELSISLTGDPFKPDFRVHAFGDSHRFTSPQQALHYIRSELLNHLRKKRNNRDKLRNNKKLRKAYRRSRRAV